MTTSATEPVVEQLPRRGDFEGAALVGPFDPDAASMDSGASLFGMPP